MSRLSGAHLKAELQPCCIAICCAVAAQVLRRRAACMPHSASLGVSGECILMAFKELQPRDQTVAELPLQPT